MLPTRKSKIRTLSGSQDERTRPEDERADSYEEQEEGEEGQERMGSGAFRNYRRRQRMWNSGTGK